MAKIDFTLEITQRVRKRERISASARMCARAGDLEADQSDLDICRVHKLTLRSHSLLWKNPAFKEEGAQPRHDDGQDEDGVAETDLLARVELKKRAIIREYA